MSAGAQERGHEGEQSGGGGREAVAGATSRLRIGHETHDDPFQARTRGEGAGRPEGYETVQMNVVVVLAPVADFPVTVTVLVPGFAPVPLIRPDGEIARPGGSPAAL
jgi:hypothetical protein